MFARKVHMHLKANTVAESTQRLEKAVLIRFCERPSYQSLKLDLKRIVSAAHKLPAEVAPPARVWRSLRVQLEKEGIFSRPVKGRLEEHTRFPMFRNSQPLGTARKAR